MDNLTNSTMLDDMQLDFMIFKLRCVGRKHLTAHELWERWIRQ